MQREPVQRACLGAILLVAGNRMPQILHMHTYLVFPASVELQLHQRISVAHLQPLVAGYGKLAILGIVGGINRELRILGKIAAYRSLFLLHLSLDDCHILAVEHHIVPIMLHCLFRLDVLREHHQSGSVAVETVDDKQLKIRVLTLQIIAQDAICSAVLFVIRRNGKHTVVLIYHDYVVVLIDKPDFRA